jgi:transcriptional regulator with XRE-family HTH domain
MARETLPEKIRKRLRKRRSELELTQEELCQRAGISLDAVSRIESGSRVPTLETLEGLARALELKVAELVQTEEPEEPKRSRPIQRTIALLERESDEVQEAAEAVVKALVKSIGHGKRDE